MSQVISIIVPIYNVEKYIHRCIDSILVQTFTNFELILVDDGSTDNCLEICNEYALKDSRIKVVHKENGGVCSARNTALDIAQGEYIGFVDSDDWIEKDMYETLYYLSMKYETDVVECDILFVNDRDDNIDKCANVEVQTGNRYFALERIMKISFSNVVWNKLYKRNIFENLRFPGVKRFEDVYITYKIILQSKKYVYTNKKMYHYYQHSNSLCHVSKYSIEVLEAVYSQQERFYTLKKLDIPKHILDLAEQRYLRDLLRHFYILGKNREDDEDNKHLDNIRKLIKYNYNGFMNNDLLKTERKWIAFICISKNLYLNTFSIYERILLAKKKCYHKLCSLKIFVKHILYMKR